MLSLSFSVSVLLSHLSLSLSLLPSLSLFRPASGPFPLEGYGLSELD
jgi:hypothetical protein